MTKLLFSAVLIVIIGHAYPAAAQRNAAACREAIDKYNSAVGDLSGYLRRYASCVSNSQGRDDCYSEFRQLRSAQDDLSRQSRSTEAIASRGAASDKLARGRSWTCPSRA